ncbi:MAG: phage holin family protein [Ruminococcus sp.]|jgi:toxin secretion/phage lysis holin|nr:phage holin family protein [Ruminococcus sp.]
MKDIFQSVVTVLMSAAVFLFGGFSGLFIALVVFIAVDYISGFAAAVIRRQLSSEVGAKGIAKKIVMLLIVATGHILDLYVVKTGDMVRDLATVFYIANEGISILENCGALGLPVPKKIADILAQLKKGQ